MWIRSAFWTGRVKPGNEAAFRNAIDDELVPALRRLPAVKGVRALWPQRLEDQPPNIACQIVVEFDDRDGVDRMLASPERQQVRGRVKELLPLFDGAISHIDYEVG